MRRTFLAPGSLALILVTSLISSAGLGLAHTRQPAKDGRPTPTPVGPAPERAPALPDSPDSPALAPRPDLIVDRIAVIPSNPRVGQHVTIRMTIKNQGTVDVAWGNNFLSDLYVDQPEPPSVHWWGCQASWVPAGGSYVLETGYAFDASKTFDLYGEVDTDGHVKESNENNNILGPVPVRVKSTIFLPLVYR